MSPNRVQGRVPVGGLEDQVPQRMTMFCELVLLGWILVKDLNICIHMVM